MKEKVQKFKQSVIDYHKKHGFSGVIRVTLRDEVICEIAVGYADAERKIPFDQNSMFTLYSMSKPFCAIGLLKLVERGLVELDAHPGRYLPEANGFDSRVTLRHLLHHTSGLPDFEQNKDFFNLYAPCRRERLREDVKAITSYPMYFEPGCGARYANVNFIIPALIIENVTGLSYEEYMKKEVFEPLGMKTVVVDRQGLEIPNRVMGYEMEEDRIIPVGKSYNWLFGAGDLVGTVDDVYCLNLAIKHKKLLKAETWAEILTPSPLNHMGMGCTVTTWHGLHRITHNGGHLGFRTLHVQLPRDDFDLILLSNSAYAGDSRGVLAEAAYEAFYGEASTDANRTEVKMDAGYI